ncbi:MAG TPA: beta-xylosidase, partial [Verrucomicrobiae bacterium]|nr:beta-xylosidase [Verrucomicrobiae bacterium]
MRFFHIGSFFAGVLFSGAGSGLAADEGVPIPVTIMVDAGKPAGDLTPIWRYFGADEPNYAYMKDGKKLLGELGQLGGSQVYFRCHHLLTSGD